MLNSTTKNRINSCRDILVGKIPDPKGQIDQITNALVYKFMDDQDRMSRELGYEASFFTGDYESYAWSRLFDTKLTNQDKANLYIEGLDRLSRADHLPDLFKQIFKDAYLPFRDANTIVMFLTEINGFDYHHSEELGNAFEYLLSIMGSQGDAGQFRTPRHIIEFLVDVVDPQKSETILDPACGTAGFLVEAFKHITAKGDLGVQDIAKLAESITGVDIDPGMAKIARVNLYLHGFKTPKITENDTLTNEKLWGTKYDVILANPPFMTPKGGIQPHDKFAIRANRAEVLFTDYIAEHLRLHGRAGIIVPEGIIFQGSNAYKDLRKMLVDDGYLWAVVSLPSGVFQPYSGVKTSILFLDRERAKKTDKILFVKVKADGYDLGAQRRKIGYEYNGEEIRLKLQNTANDQMDVVSANLLGNELTFDYLGQKRVLKGFQNNDLPTALYLLQVWKQNIDQNTQHLPEQVLSELYFDIANLVEKSKIAESGDYNLSGDKYIAGTVLHTSSFELTKLDDLVEIKNGYAFQSEKYAENGYQVIRITNVQKGFIDPKDPKFYPENEVKNLSDFVLSKGDLLMSLTGNVGRVGVLQAEHLPAVLNQRVAKLAIKNSTILNQNYLFHLLNSDKFENDVINLSGGVAQKNLGTTNLKEYKIPLPPLEIQEQIVAELDGYQRIIDGACAVIENYKPTIKMDPEWEMVELGEVANFAQGIQVDIDGQSKEPQEGYIRFWRIIDFTQEIKGDERYIENPRDKSLIKEDDIVMVRYGATAGFVGTGKKGALANNLFKIEVNQNILINKFTYYFLRDQKTQNLIFQLAGGGAMQALSFGIMKKIKIPLPTLEIQQSIVERIEEEQRLVDANRRLIEIYEEKIKEKMDEVWGVE